MRDTYHADDLPEDSAEDLPTTPAPGMRHSIRPRRVVVEKMNAPHIENTPLTSPAVQRQGRYVADADTMRWDALEMVDPGAKRAISSAMPVVDSERDSPTVRAFDLLRTRLRQTTQEHGWRNIAVTAPTTGCGNTFTAVNLALSLSRIPGSRTVLMDLNLRDPGVARAFDMQAPGAMGDFLSGEVPMGDHLQRLGDTLALGLNDHPDENPAETLQSAATAVTLDRMRAALRPELVIYDMPAMLAYDDISAFLPQLDGVLLVSDGTQTMSKQLVECERMLEGQVPLLGVVLNRARKNSVPAYT